MTTLQEAIDSFDPNAPAQEGRLYGLPFDCETAKVVIIPVPWGVTVSSEAGTENAPAAILEESLQVDLYDPLIDDAWKIGIAMDDIPTGILRKNDWLRKQAEKCMSYLAKGEQKGVFKDLVESIHQHRVANINAGSAQLNEYVMRTALQFLREGKLVGTLGGDHSTPLGLIRALAQGYSNFSILHLDAHADLRREYEGFEFSHASIMYNALRIPSVKRLVSVGIRDYCEEEAKRIRDSKNIIAFPDKDIKGQLFQCAKDENAKNWHQICEDITDSLSGLVYVSFDIDCFDPKLCPNTGTKVPGGFEFEEVFYLLEMVAGLRGNPSKRKRIIGFDLSEVGNAKFDANVGSRALYRLANLAYISQRE